jgi:hypothetical protein
LFGIDEVELKLAGQSNGTTASCSGRAEQAPELPFHAALIRFQDQPLVVSAITGNANPPVR